MSKGSFVVVANCQGWPLVQALQSLHEFQQRFAWINIPPVFEIATMPADRQDAIAGLVASADLLLYQPTKGHFGKFSTDSLLAARKSGSISLSIPNCYFTGYQPEVFYFNLDGRRVVDLPSEYNDANLLWAASEDVGLEIAAARMADPGFYPAVFVLGNADDSLNVLRHREESIDVPISDVIAERWKKERLFHAFNHPTNGLMATLADRVMAALGIMASPVDPSAIQSALARDVLPIYASVGSVLSISAQPILINGTTMDPRRYCNTWLESFRGKYLQRVTEILTDIAKSPGRAATAFSKGEFVKSPVKESKEVTAQTEDPDSARARFLAGIGQDSDFVLTKCDPQSRAFMIELMPVIAELYPSQSSLSALDVGARTAAGTDLLARTFAPDSFNLPKMQVAALDIGGTFQAYSQRFHPRVKYLVEDVFVHAVEYDLVICSHTLEHVPDPKAFLRRLQQIARGHVLVACPYGESRDHLIPGHLHAIDWEFIKEFQPERFRVYKSMAWHQSLACWFVLQGQASAHSRHA